MLAWDLILHCTGAFVTPKSFTPSFAGHPLQLSWTDGRPCGFIQTSAAVHCQQQVFCTMITGVANVRCSAITLGRLAWICPEPIAPHLEHFIAPWCQALRTVRDDVEKEHAFLGLAALLRLNARVLPAQERASLALHLAFISALMTRLLLKLQIRIVFQAFGRDYCAKHWGKRARHCKAPQPKRPNASICLRLALACLLARG